MWCDCSAVEACSVALREVSVFVYCGVRLACSVCLNPLILALFGLHTPKHGTRHHKQLELENVKGQTGKLPKCEDPGKVTEEDTRKPGVFISNASHFAKIDLQKLQWSLQLAADQSAAGLFLDLSPSVFP
jgi:hypothetical protein